MTLTARALDVEALLAPIAGDSPAGADLRYELVYDEVRAARRGALERQQGRAALGDANDGLSPEERAASAADDWIEVQALLSDLLVSRTKDLQLAVWLLEAETFIGGFEAATRVLALVRRLMETYWDSLYPGLDDEDEPLALRAGALEWINDRFPAVLSNIPLTSGSRKFSLGHWALAQRATDEELKLELAKAGRPSLDQLAQAMTASNQVHLEALATQIEACLGQINELEKVTDTLFASPGGRGAALLSFGQARKVLEDCQFQVGRALRAKAPRQDPKTATAPAGQPDVTRAVPTGDGIWDRALQLVMQGQLEGMRLAQDHIEAAVSGRERFLRQLHLSELCLQVGMHAFAYPILDELGKVIEKRDLASWEDPDVIRRTWAGLAAVCKPLARIRPESVARANEAQQHLDALESGTQPPSPSES